MGQQEIFKCIREDKRFYLFNLLQYIQDLDMLKLAIQKLCAGNATDRIKFALRR
jgi:hypothetical protein